jgi:hypothetical protein
MNFIRQPTYVGYYVLNWSADASQTVRWSWEHKPSLWHRLMVRAFFGWRWFDIAPKSLSC